MTNSGEQSTDIPEDADPAALIDAGRPEDAVEAAREQARREVASEIMNLARHLYDESRNLGIHVSQSERYHGNELASAIYQARADGLQDSCQEIRQLSRWLEGDRDRPASLHHGEQLGDDGKRVPDGHTESVEYSRERGGEE